ncbi:hypothetical protein TAMA11512_21600 [Selenomonas sp. TAMA-11512]|uniref:hypothetical protein n=1 Tax=Selenomonas sp. TAMA-11512 TaxID=3095337 RepID=UPI00308C926F|nr:hypothetical protein TAMA11512_09000 [Selenomonas sp. TAMA-11512]BEU88696.1 hypothetical protein TAMA11512_21600 [Selenomonas sp. TAMA-11512]
MKAVSVEKAICVVETVLNYIRTMDYGHEYLELFAAEVLERESFEVTENEQIYQRPKKKFCVKRRRMI